ncbi:hypothetical protein DFH27DRAFT_650147 [Peziza echinospora]|nr:hypothetical protein DFH27DRAFT_650147 [Peziza echinospora]
MSTASGLPSESTKAEWEAKLVGKKLVDEGTASARSTGGGDVYPRDQLPKPSRVCKPGGLFTMDYNTERLNVHVDNDDVVTHVTLG